MQNPHRKNANFIFGNPKLSNLLSLKNIKAQI